MQYGRNKYDYEEGVLQFMAPNQIVTSHSHTKSTYGFMLFFHPALIRNFDLGKLIGRYTFFNYSVHEALHLSKKEEDTLIEIVSNIEAELSANIDKHSAEVIVTNLQLFLNYSKRFYERQFITRTNNNSDVISKIEGFIKEYYNKNLQLEHGTPSPDYFAEKISLSTNYLSDLLKKETGRSTKNHVDDYVVELAKTELLNSTNTVSEIAFDLGFNYPHYFSRMFKKRTGETPQQFREKTLN
jgi:YesN/AraC family two-component response regulator